jgi:hypothetical protein
MGVEIGALMTHKGPRWLLRVLKGSEEHRIVLLGAETAKGQPLTYSRFTLKELAFIGESIVKIVKNIRNKP